MRSVRGVLGAGREWVLRSQKGYRWHKGHWGILLGVGHQEPLGESGGVRGVLGAGRECRYSGARRV